MMKAKRRQGIWLVSSIFLLVSFGGVLSAAAQIGDGSLRGTVRDEQNLALPGATITIDGPELINPRTATSDGSGNYLFSNLPPGTYTLTAELEGFSIYKQEGIILRAGANFQVNATLKIGAMSETVTVTAESPMLEVTRPSNQLNIDGEFQTEVPLSDGKFWSDFLDLTPGVLTRPHNDGSGRQNYFGNAVDHRDAVLLMEGLVASNYNDSNINRTGLSTAAIEDTQVKLGGVDAASPMGYGLIINAVTKSGGNTLSGSADYTYQNIDWYNDNTGGTGTPANRQINQADFSLGGPIVPNKVWIFGAARITHNLTNSARTPERTETLKALFNVDTLQNNNFDGFQPYVKVTGQLSDNHTLSGVFQNDRLDLKTTSQIAVRQLEVLSTGGSMYGAKLVSIWGPDVTTNFNVSYNNKGGNDKSSYAGLIREGIPSVEVHQTADAQGGVLEGSGVVAEDGANQSVGCYACLQFDKASVLMARGDLTWYKDDWAGSHQFETGFFLLPRNKYSRTEEYLNNGFILESQAFNDPNDPSAGTYPFHRQYITSDLTSIITDGRDVDDGFYVQDTWKPSDRLTATIGIRFDLVRREDVRRGLQYQSSTEIGPRLGFSYLLTEDAKNVLRGSYGRVHEQLQGGRHPVSSFGGEPSASFRDTYDVLGDGSFSSVIDTPPQTSEVSEEQYASGLSQPHIDEGIIGFRRQFAGEIAIDVAGVFRTISNMFGRVDINGIYPSGPRQPFIGFGLVDPNAGIVNQLRNNDWSKIHYQALQITVTKNMSRGFQAMAAIHKQWQHLSGTWNPTDRAYFIEGGVPGVQVDAFPNNKLLFRTRGPADHNTLPGSTNANMWFPYSIRLAGTWHAPYGVQVSATWSMIKPSWSGPITDRLGKNDPDLATFGTPTVISSTGVSQSNPLYRRERYRFDTRGEGQELLPLVHQVGLKFQKRINVSGSHNLLLGFNILNLTNGGNGLEFARGGANRSYSGPTIFLQPGNLQPPRSFQIDIGYQF
jgi:hypothetical protein